MELEMSIGDLIYGRKDGSQRGRKTGGRGRNRTTTCRHPYEKLKGGKKK